MDYTEGPVSFPQLETQFIYKFKGLHMLFDIDLINQNCYNQVPGEPTQMDPRDVALLTDIEALHINNSKMKGSYYFPTCDQECSEPFGKERYTVPRLQHLGPESEELDLESISVEQQIQIVQKTFVDIDRPLAVHPTKSNSTARPIAQLPVFPEPSQIELVQANFSIPPFDSANGILKDCGSFFIRYKQKPEPVFQRINQKYGKHLTAYLSEQLFKEDQILESSVSGDKFILREKENRLYYNIVSKHINLTKDRVSPNSFSNLSLLASLKNYLN